MRTRFLAITAALVTLAFVAAMLGSHAPVRALQTDGSPVASPVADDATPEATEEDEAAPEDDEGDEPEFVSQIVTMVFWYQQNSTGEILYLSPIEYDGFTATAAEPANESEEGRIVFEESRNDGYPRIRVGEDTYFDAFPLFTDDPNTVQRWLYYEDDPNIRPATMMMQITGIRGDYEGWFGTATFISRGGEPGGILVIAISPPLEDETEE
jgi:hypothetical protein